MNEKVVRDAYYVIHTKMPSGFECKIPARGYNLKSWLEFETRLGSTFYYERTTEAVYNHLVFGDPNAIIEDEGCQSPVLADTKSKTSTKRSPAPRKTRASTKTVGKEQSTTRRSVKPATKSTKKQTSSSTTKRKK